MSFRFTSFYWAAALWLVLGGALVAVLSEDWKSLAVFFGIFSFVNVNLYVIARLSQALVGHVGGKETAQGSLFFWAILKILCLGAFALMVFHLDSVAKIPLLVGLLTLVIVPVLGGLGLAQTMRPTES